MSEQINEKGLEAVAKRFMRRSEIKDWGLSLEEVKATLLQHARQYGGCINCVYSAPAKGKLSWKGRTCILGLAQNSCGGMQKKLIKR